VARCSDPSLRRQRRCGGQAPASGVAMESGQWRGRAGDAEAEEDGPVMPRQGGNWSGGGRAGVARAGG
jgi:hypothetical protein